MCSLQTLECRGRGCESVLELGFILCVASSYVGRGLETGLFPVKRLLSIVYTEDSEIQKTKGCGCVGIKYHAERRVQSYVSVCNCVPVHSGSNTGLPLLDEIINAHGVFSYSDFDRTPY